MSQSAEVQVSIAPADLVDRTAAIPDAFAGLDLPLADVTRVIGDSNGLNPQFANLLKNLTMYATNGHMRVRIGNDTLAWTGPKAPHKDRIPALALLARQFNISYLLGVDFKSGDLEATRRAMAALSDAASGLPAKSIEAWELGNEADLYPAATQPAGNWNTGQYASRFASYTAAVGKVAAPVWAGTRGPFFAAGHADGIDPLDGFVARNAAGIGMVDMHQYYGSNCHGASLAPGDLLKPAAAAKAQAAFRQHIAVAHAHQLPFILSEWNSASCGGISGVSDTFESALWTLDGLFEWLDAGLDGVTITTGNGLPYSPWHFTAASSGTKVSVAPIYYGLRMFLQATQDSAKRTGIALSNRNHRNIKAWATIDARRIVRLVLINKDTSFTGAVEVSLPAYAAPRAYPLTASNYRATSGLKYAGQTFDNSADGNPAGPLDAPVLAASAAGHYRFDFGGVGAVLLEFRPSP